MKLYGQRQEDQYIINYFHGTEGKFLDIGAFHPEVFSNVRALYEMGWKGTLVEPARHNYPFIKEYYKDDKEIEVIQTCVGSFDGEVEFHDSMGDAVSSISLDHKIKWENGYGSKFETYQSPICTFATLINNAKYDQYDFINLDVEGLNWEILQTIEPMAVNCKMLCVEFDDKKAEISHYMQSRGYSMIHETPENLIFAL